MRRLADLPLHTYNPSENYHNSKFFPPHESVAKSPFVVATCFLAEKIPVRWMTERGIDEQPARPRCCSFGVTSCKHNTYNYTTNEAITDSNLFSHESESQVTE